MNSNTCERDSTVSGIFESSVVAIMKMTCGGGSSIDFSSALNEWFESWWTSSMMKTLYRSRTGMIDRPGDDHLAHVVDLRVRGGVDLEDVDVAAFRNLDGRRRTRRTGFAVGPFSQFSARARIRAVVVLPTPRGPGKHERLRDAAARDGVAQRTRHGRLADDVVELLRAPLAGENLVGHCGKRFGVPVLRFWAWILRGPEGLRHSSGTT